MSILSHQNQSAERENDEKIAVCGGDFSFYFSRVQSGVEFILTHFKKESWFPRRVSTAATRREQRSKQQRHGNVIFRRGFVGRLPYRRIWCTSGKSRLIIYRT